MDKELKIRNQLMKSFSHCLEKIQDYGAEHIGYRYFLPDGR